jgi:hypothetical protein
VAPFTNDAESLADVLYRARNDAELLPVDAFARSSDAAREVVLDALASAAHRLRSTAGAEPWMTRLLALAHGLTGSGAFLLGRPAFLGSALIGALLAEARALGSDIDPNGSRRSTRNAGDALARVAVSRQLREVVSAAAGHDLAPTFDALYEFDPPGSHVRAHFDSRGYEWTCHVLLVHEGTPPVLNRTSVLVAYLPDGAVTLQVRAGDAVLLRGRGTLHEWLPLAADERRIMTAIGFRSA